MGQSKFKGMWNLLGNFHDENCLWKQVVHDHELLCADTVIPRLTSDPANEFFG
jgi:hypothetical protein